MEEKIINKKNMSGSGRGEEVEVEIDNSKEAMIRSYILNNCIKKNVPLKNFIYEIEKELIIKALKVSGGNQRVASFILGIKPTTLNEKIKKFHIRTNKKIRGKSDLKYLIDDINISLY
ncbi:MAG: helix-turn-helix domain-containing protein [Acidobacteriota bacterium]